MEMFLLLGVSYQCHSLLTTVTVHHPLLRSVLCGSVASVVKNIDIGYQFWYRRDKKTQHWAWNQHFWMEVETLMSQFAVVEKSWYRCMDPDWYNKYLNCPACSQSMCVPLKRSTRSWCGTFDCVKRSSSADGFRFWQHEIPFLWAFWWLSVLISQIALINE